MSRIAQRIGESLRGLAIATALAVVFCSPASALVGFEKHPQSGHHVITVHGPIRTADIEELRAWIDFADKTGKTLHMDAVRLNTGGGDSQAAMELGRIIRKRELNTFVGPKDHCGSACIYLLIAGVIRMAYGNVYVHRFRFSDREVPEDQIREQVPKGAAARRTYIAEMGVSPLLTEAIDNTPNWALRRLKPQELLHWNVHGINHVEDEILTRRAANSAGMKLDEFNDFYVDMLNRCKREAMRFERLVFDCLVKISYERQAGVKPRR